MKTIGAKELRLHLDQVLDRVLRGEDIVVRHRFKEPVRLSALHAPFAKSPGKPVGLQAFDAAQKRTSPFNPDKSVKELYHEFLSGKYR